MDVGVEFGHYRVLEHIGRGGMADVWSARDKRLNRTVAIKTMMRDLSREIDPVRMFEREATVIASLEHPHILPIYEFGDYENQLYIVMRYVTGGSVEALVGEGAVPLDEVLRVGRAVAQALDYAHDNNVVHLDLKPSNILLDSHQSPYLADFGLAAFLGPEGRAVNPGSGTLLYMAPEQLTSDVLDHRADIYSFSIMLFHMLTGQLPFDATMPLALKQIQFQQNLPEIDLLSPNLPVELTDVLRQGTAIEPAQRPNRASALMQELEAVVKARAAVEFPSLIGAALPGDADLGDMITQPSTGPEAQAKREAADIYNRARRVWAFGQGRFLLGITHFMLVNDFYMRADFYGLELDEAGRQMLLRGALEYDHEIDYWWDQLGDESRRWVALHTIRSENAPARVRAFQRLAALPDAETPIIPVQVAQQLQVETNEDAMLAALDTLVARANMGGKRVLDLPYQRPRATSRTTHMVQLLTEQLELRAPQVWEEVVFSPEVDLLLADIALTSEIDAAAERAARAIGQIYSLAAVRLIAAQQRKGAKGALRALALVRDEAPTLPAEVSGQARLYAWLANTWRRLSENPIQIVRRFLLALVGAFFALGLNTYITYRAEAIFAPARLKNGVAVGLTIGVLIGFLVLLADEFPSRLRGFWPLWARLLWSVILGGLMGIGVWAGYTYLYLENPLEANLIYGGIGLALGFIASTIFQLPGWAAWLVTTLATYIPLYITFQSFMPPVVYYDYPEQIFTLALPVSALIALGGHWQAIWRDIKRWTRRAPRQDAKVSTQTVRLRR